MDYCPEEFCIDLKINFTCGTKLDLNLGFETCNNSFTNMFTFHNSLEVTVILVHEPALFDKLQK